MELRRARPDEYAEIGDVTLAAYAPYLDGSSEPYRDRLRDAAARDREAELWVAVDDDGLLGTVTVVTDGSPWREIAGPNEGEFRMLAVHPNAQGRGVGAALVDLVLDRSRRRGHDAVVLCTLAAMTPAIGVYERLGFRRLPERDWTPLPGVDLIAFGRDLTTDPDDHLEEE